MGQVTSLASGDRQEPGEEDRKGFLVISPHLDDEALGCGGILDSRFHVHYCGVERFREVDRETRIAEARACAGLLGFSFSLEEGNVVNAYEVPRLIGQIEGVINRLRPHTVFLPSASYNQDHRTVLDAALTALRPHDRNHAASNVLLYEQVHVVTWPERHDLLRGRAPEPDFFVSIDVERKIEAYRCHASQVRGMRTPEMVRAVARWRGFQAGFDHAEAFTVVRICEPLRLDLGRQVLDALGDTP
jgi:LmbE family N-acetylglucosaminyl deacetylase